MQMRFGIGTVGAYLNSTRSIPIVSSGVSFVKMECSNICRFWFPLFGCLELICRHRNTCSVFTQYASPVPALLGCFWSEKCSTTLMTTTTISVPVGGEAALTTREERKLVSKVPPGPPEGIQSFLTPSPGTIIGRLALTNTNRNIPWLLGFPLSPPWGYTLHPPWGGPFHFARWWNWNESNILSCPLHPVLAKEWVGGEGGRVEPLRNCTHGKCTQRWEVGH